MEFPEESGSPDSLFYLVGWAHLIILGDVLIYEIKKNVAKIFDLSIEPSMPFNTMDQDSIDVFQFQGLAVSSIFIYYLVKLAPVRALKQRKEKRAQEEKVEQEKRLQREAKAQSRHLKKALWTRKEEGLRTIAESVFPKIVSFEYNLYLDRLEIETNEQKLHYNDALKRKLPDIRKEMQKDYEDRGVSRTSYVSRYGRSSVDWSNQDDDINSVDGGSPSEAYAQSGWVGSDDDDDG